jgi:hypothetical protein
LEIAAGKRAQSRNLRRVDYHRALNDGVKLNIPSTEQARRWVA